MAHILITNDDGIQAEGLRALVQAVEGLGTISVVAPSHERSAAAQSLTLRQPIFWEQVAEREWAVEGTPVAAGDGIVGHVVREKHFVMLVEPPLFDAAGLNAPQIVATVLKALRWNDAGVAEVRA